MVPELKGLETFTGQPEPCPTLLITQNRLKFLEANVKNPELVRIFGPKGKKNPNPEAVAD